MSEINDFIITDITFRELSTMVKKIMIQTGINNPIEAVRMMNSGGLEVYNKNPNWTEKDKDIRFSVTSDGTSGKKWISRLKNKNCRFGDFAESVLRSKSFKPTNGIIYKIAVIRIDLSGNINLKNVTIDYEAKGREYITPHPEIFCLIRDKFSNGELKKMGFDEIVTMHKPIVDCSGNPAYLSTYNHDNDSWITVNHNFHHFHFETNKSVGFAYVVSQTTP